MVQQLWYSTDAGILDSPNDQACLNQVLKQEITLWTIIIFVSYQVKSSWVENVLNLSQVDISTSNYKSSRKLCFSIACCFLCELL
jgi:hypothetical protein